MPSHKELTMKRNGKTHVKVQHPACRRRFLQLSGSMLVSSLMIQKAESAEIDEKGDIPLSENDRIGVNENHDSMIKTAYDLGYAYEKEFRGCARCTVAALQDALTFIPEELSLFRAASCLDGGATPTKLANCGAFTGSGMYIGWLCGTDRFGDNALSHDLIHKLHERFETEYGSVICKTVREQSNDECPEVVGKAAKWSAEILLEQFTGYKKP